MPPGPVQVPPPPPPPPAPASEPPPYPSPPPRRGDELPPSGPGALASIGQRALARLIDLFVVSLPMQVWALAAGYVRAEGGQAEVDAPDWFIVLTLVLPVVYELVLIGWRGRTLGKVALRIRVASYTTGAKPSWQQAAFRALLPAAPQFVAVTLPASMETLGFALTMVSVYFYVAAVFDPMTRGLHDKAAGTVVLRTR